MARDVYLHIGLPKTGTTYLQTILWSSRPQLRRDGLLLPGSERRDHLWASRVVREDRGVKNLPPRAATSWDRLRSEIAGWSHRALVDHEFFAAASRKQAEAVVAQLAPANVHLIVTAREPVGLFAASWQESLKNRECEPIATYSREVSRNPLDVWNWRTLDLGLVLRRWTTMIPAHQVHVVPLAPDRPQSDLWHRFGDILGLATDTYDVSEAFANASMGVVEAETLRRVNAQLVGGTPPLPHDFRRAFDRGVYLRTFLADERLVPRGGERFLPPGDRIEECRIRAEEAIAYVQEQGFDVRGDLANLRVPAELPDRRTPESVTDAEVADVATWLVGRLLGDVRELDQAARQDGRRRGAALIERWRRWRRAR